MATRSVIIGARDTLKPTLHSEVALDGRGSPGTGGVITPTRAAKKFSDKLTFYEKREIEGYPEVYYVGQNCKSKVKAPTSGPNDGYDTDNGEYVIVEGDHIAYRYEIVGHLGSGAFGQVVKAIDHATGDCVAIKLIRNKKKVANQAKTEIQILEHIHDKDPLGKYNVVQMFSNFTFRSHMCIAYELLGTNLYDHMEQTQFYPMAIASVRKVAARMLVALTFLWKENIIHCDLKPENILYKTDASSDVVKVADLGSACYDSSCAYTYIQSRFYRAPEVILGLPYGRPIDLWSFGCILCELATGYPLFPGENEKDQLACIMEYLGKPPGSMIMAAKKRRLYFEDDLEPKTVPNSKGRLHTPGTKTFSSFVGLDCDDEFISFLDQFLRWDPDDRVPPRQAMRHPWIEDEFVFTVNEVAVAGGAQKTATKVAEPAPAVDHSVRGVTDTKSVGTKDFLKTSGGLSSPKRCRLAMLTFDAGNGDSAKNNAGESRDGLEDSGFSENARSLVVADHHSVSISVPPSVRQAKLSNSLSQSGGGEGGGGAKLTKDAQIGGASGAAPNKPVIHLSQAALANGNASTATKKSNAPLWGRVPLRKSVTEATTDKHTPKHGVNGRRAAQSPHACCRARPVCVKAQGGVQLSATGWPSTAAEQRQPCGTSSPGAWKQSCCGGHPCKPAVRQ
ncbi:dual specificity tyrosine-phosphorylation-regulated kinase 2-like [Bactrocera neohumeralis]|uniref:dual specificity tyrosine-phosphorylation-regulated kinase 2-like n=1 Tax=Bactrocera neohumeralis TaxID=98809 RepID=UPI0021668C46|nr:dual specificity tyrosine-phosphorylation-regulated kinase 2-like [Bactrocera neohumeralis]